MTSSFFLSWPPISLHFFDCFDRWEKINSREYTIFRGHILPCPSESGDPVKIKSSSIVQVQGLTPKTSWNKAVRLYESFLFKKHRSCIHQFSPESQGEFVWFTHFLSRTQKGMLSNRRLFWYNYTTWKVIDKIVGSGYVVRKKWVSSHHALL